MDVLTLSVFVFLFSLIVVVYILHWKRQQKLDVVASNQQEIIKLTSQLVNELKETRKEIEIMKSEGL